MIGLVEMRAFRAAALSSSGRFVDHEMILYISSPIFGALRRGRTTTPYTTCMRFARLDDTAIIKFPLLAPFTDGRIGTESATLLGLLARDTS
jgi:hypothetical protein